MKPLRIEISNFGAIPHAVIDLIGVGVASICGPNGAGKSTAITIAPMFSLFGTTKGGCSADDMVRTGATEASVTFDFEHHGDVWRVIRTRSTKGKGKSTLELQRQSGELWAAESGASIAETQKKIIRLLNLDEETFSSSSMILQGRANEFTSRPAGQRKAILAQILQLEQYDNLYEKAKAKVQEVNVSLEKCKAKVADIDGRLATKPSLEGEKLDVELQLANLKRFMQKGEADVQEAMVNHSALVAKIQEADKVRLQADALAAEITTKSIERDRQQVRLDNAQKLLERESEILDKVLEYETTKETVTVLKTKQDQQIQLKTEADQLVNELTSVTVSLDKSNAEIIRMEKILADRPRLVVAQVDHDNALARLSECQKEYEEDQRLLNAVKACTDQLLRAEDRYLNQEKIYNHQIESLQSKTSMLAKANCIDINRAQCEFLADAVKAKGELTTVQGQYGSWKAGADKEIAELQSALKTAQTARREYNFNPLERYELQDKINLLKPDVELLAKLGAMEPLIENLKSQCTELETRQTDINSRLEVMRSRYRELSEGLKQLPDLKNKLSTLEPWVKSKDQLPAAREIASSARDMIDKLNSEITAAQVKEAELRIEYQGLIGNSEALIVVAANKVTAAQEELKRHRDDHTHLITRLGGIQAKLESLAQDEDQRITLVAEMEPLTKQLIRWQTLVKAFGRDGIPALIIENAVPDLERIANDILGQMSGGKNYLKFETQRELKSGKGMAETLDIIVGDYAGERIYETFSGGEQLRIDFAIRFALAELLARRAGSRIDFLCIDEGFGSQSDEYLPAVIDAVKSVANRFGLVLVISHVKAVQEAFEQKIHFLPTGDGVEVQVA